MSSSSVGLRDDSESYGSRRDLVQRRGTQSSRGTTSTTAADSKYYQPGTPIGYLAARGTPFEKKYFTKKLGFCCLFLAPPVLLVTGVITLVPVLWAIAKHALHTSQLHVYQSNITSITNTSFPLTILGQVKKTGIFPAKLYFRKPVDVYWNTPPPELREVHLGRFKLDSIGAAAGHARLFQATTFYIEDVEGFGIFARWLVSEKQFTWQTRCNEVHAEGFSFFPVYKELNFVKDVIINGINNFEDIKIVDLQLPGNDPAGGIQAIATTTLINPSPFGVELGTLNLALYYKDLYLGPVQGTNINVSQGLNTITLYGRVVPYQNNVTALEILGELFTNYINSVVSTVEARGVSTQLANGETIGWLSTGITALVAQIPFVPPTPIDPIKGIIINYVSLVYSEATPYNPVLFSNTLTGTFALPFGFSLNITNLATQLNIFYKGAPVGTVNGPYGNSSTNLQLVSIGETAGTIDLTLPPAQLILPNDTTAARVQLVEFQNAFTFQSSSDFIAQGLAKAISDTPIGRILLNGIKFNITTGLAGLNGLTTYPTIINSVDVTGGAPDAVTLVVGLTTINPSNINISSGDATFNLINQIPLGNATLPNLVLKPGRNDIQSTSFFDPNRSPLGLETLNRFISGLDTFLNVSGFDGSSRVESLIPTLSGIRINATLPGLKQNLAQAANLTVLSTTGIVDDVANSHVQLFNPFTAPITITSIAANASSHGIYIANINTALNFAAAGKAVTTSPVVPLVLNLYPPDLFGLLRALVIDSGQDPAYLDGLVQLAGFTLTPTTNANSPTRKRKRGTNEFIEEDEMSQILMGVGTNPGALFKESNDQGLVRMGEEVEDFAAESDGFAKRAEPLAYDGLHKRANIYSGFDITTYVGRAFSVATADLTIVSNAVIGQYGTTLTFSQNDVPLGTDETLFLLLPVLALPIVQRIVDGSILNIDRVTITEATANGFTATIQGALTNAGPFDGVVTFPNGLTIYWEGQALTSTAFPNVALVGDVGSALNVQVQGTIPNVDYFTQFLQYAIINPSFVWNIKGDGISVAALGIVVGGVTINKDVQLTGLNGLKGNVIINSFDVPYNEPGGGLHLTAVSTINNPAQVGVFLTQFGTSIMMGDVTIGPTAAAQAFTLQALAVTEVPLAGTISQQNDAAGLSALSDIFTRFVHNQNTDLVVNGAYAGPSDVAWLNNGIKALSVTVSLPAQDFQVIRLVSINQLSLFFTVDSAWAPMSDTTNTQAHFFLPFGLPVNIQSVAGPFIANYQNTQMAVLNIPTSPTLTDVDARILTLMFTNVPFSVYDPAHAVFSQFVADVTKNEQVTFNLNGMATGVTATGAGVLTIADIPFNLNTNILGLQNLNARPAIVSNLDVVHGYPTYLLITVNTQLYNPSDITISAGDISFAALFQNNVIGNAIIRQAFLVPGVNNIPTQINYMPMGAQNVASGQTLLQNYVQNVSSDTIVQGNSQTTPIPSLLQGLSGIQLTATIPPLFKLIVISAFLEVPRNIAQTGIAQTSVMIANPFTASINIIQLGAQAIYQGITIGTINQDLSANPIRAPGKVTTQSRTVDLNVNLDPKVLIRFIQAAAISANVNIDPLLPFFAEVLALPSTTTTISPFPDDAAPPYNPSCNSGRAFDTLGAILALLKPLAASIPIQSTVKIDDYQTNLDFIQQPVPVGTDRTALYLVGPAGAPLIQLIVNQSILTVTQANATNITDSGFTASLLGSLATNAPADALIEFVDPVIINYLGNDIAEVALPPLCSSPPNGIPVLQSTGLLTILNEALFEDFAYDILVKPNFQWFLHSNTVRVRALGIAFSDTILQKTIQLDSFNGLPGLRITQFTAPSDAPGIINIAATVPIPSPASLGVELGNATFEAFFQGSSIGFISSSGLFLLAKATTIAPLTGYLHFQANGTKGLADVGVLFSQYLAGQDSTLTVRGVSVISPASNGQPVRWLTAGFQRFTTTTILPGQIYQIIYSIVLSDLTAFIFQDNRPYAIPSSNNQTIAMFSNPFGFSLQPVQAGPSIILTYNNIETASLNLPLAQVVAGTSNGPNNKQPLQLGFKMQTINSLNDPNFQAFFAALADTGGAQFGLKGTTAVVANTQIGYPTITGIPFNVTTSLAGIDSFGNKATVSNVIVDDPETGFIGIHLTAGLNNPSMLTIFTDRVSLPTVYNTRNVVIGRAFIPTLGLIPLQNNVGTLFEFMIPNNSSDVQEVLEFFLQPHDLMTPDNATQANNIGLTINGNAAGTNIADLSPYSVLQPALQGVTAATTLEGIAVTIAKRIDVYLPKDLILQILKLILCPILSAAGLTSALDPVLGAIGTAAGETTGAAFCAGYTTPTTNPLAGPFYIKAILTAQNDLPIKIQLNHISSSVFGYNYDNGTKYAQFDFDFVGANAFTLNAAQAMRVPNPDQPTQMSPVITNILLTQGLSSGTLGLIGHNLNIDNWINANAINNANGASYNIPGLHYVQDNVPTTYNAGDPGQSVPITGTVDGLNGLLGAIGLGGLTTILGFNPTALLGVVAGVASATNGGASIASGISSSVCSLAPVLCAAAGAGAAVPLIAATTTTSPVTTVPIPLTTTDLPVTTAVTSVAGSVTSVISSVAGNLPTRRDLAGGSVATVAAMRREERLFQAFTSLVEAGKEFHRENAEKPKSAPPNPSR